MIHPFQLHEEVHNHIHEVRIVHNNKIKIHPPMQGHIALLTKGCNNQQDVYINIIEANQNYQDLMNIIQCIQMYVTPVLDIPIRLQQFC